MRQFKFITILLMYLFLIYLMFKNQSTQILLSFIILNVIFVIKYFSLQNTVSNYNKVVKTALQDQREYFINALNHDLRIPIIAQLRAIELINKESFGTLNIQQKEMLYQTEQSGRCILNLISLLINTYNMENSTYKLIYDKFNLYDTITSCFNEVINEAKEKNITFEFNTINKNIYLAADKEEIKKVIKNLLIAAIEYANLNGTVVINIKQVNKKLQMSVKIKESIKSKCSPEKYDSRYTAIGQTIRLHFCKKIIELHNGQVLQNNSQIKSFMFELPQSA